MLHPCNLLYSKWCNSHVWSDFRIISSNQKAVFTQLASTWFKAGALWWWLREKERGLANMSLEFEYLHLESWCKMLIGGDDISNDVITLGKFKFTPVFTSGWLVEIWQLSDREPRGDWRWNSNSKDVVVSSPSFSRPAARAPWKAACSQDKCNIVYSFLQ